MQSSIPGHFLAPKPQPVKSLAEAFDLFRSLAGTCELLQICLRAPKEKLALRRAEQFNQLANQLLYTFTIACDVLKTGNLHGPLAARYTSPVRFGNVSSTCYASLAKDAALAQVKVLEDYWREIHGGKIVHVTLNPQYAFNTEQVAEIRKRFEALKTFEFPGTADEQLEAIRASFGELIVGLRQEQAWAAANGITLGSGETHRGAVAKSVVRLPHAADTGEPTAGEPAPAVNKGKADQDILAAPAGADSKRKEGIMAEVWRELLESRRRLFLAAAERYPGLRCLLVHAGPSESEKVKLLPTYYAEWRCIQQFGNPNGPTRSILLPPRAFDDTKRTPDGYEMTTPMFAEYSTLTQDAGQIISEAPHGLIPWPADFVARGSASAQWIQVVFHLTKCPREFWDPADDVRYPWDSENMRGLMNLFPRRERFRQWAEQLPDYWMSDCADVLRASHDAIVLLAQDPKATVPTAGSGSSSRPEELARRDGINGDHLNLEDGNLKERVRRQVFISYSHKDQRWVDDLSTHLKPYLRDGSITAWSDHQITTGSKWFAQIQAALARTSVAVLLVTPSFLASDFIQEHELHPILKEAERGGVRIVWIPVEACSFKKTALKDYQAVIAPEKPLATMKKPTRDAAWVKICQEIEKAVKEE